MFIYIYWLIYIHIHFHIFIVWLHFAGYPSANTFLHTSPDHLYDTSFTNTSSTTMRALCGGGVREGVRKCVRAGVPGAVRRDDRNI